MGMFRQTRKIIFVAAAVLALAGSAFALPTVSELTGNFSLGTFYNGPAASPASEIQIVDRGFDNGMFIGTGFWFVENATISWTGSKLDVDYSAGGAADATFKSGGTFTITGKMTDYMTDITGTLLTGTVSALRYTETASPLNNLSLSDGVTVDVTGGLLASANATGETMFGLYSLAFPVTDCAQTGGAALTSFQDSIWATRGGLVSLSRVPEPTTMLLVAAGGLFGMVRRKK
jgi:hypothetical protein